MSGLLAAIRLKQAGFAKLLIVERSEGLGGTWWSNRYPGCACDIPSHFYSYSFAPNPDWTRAYPQQSEILTYFGREEGWRQYTRDVQIKRLWDENTFLLRCAPGGVLPAHKHPRFEHCVVIEGDMIVDGETYRSGDYHGVPAHIGHNDITSRTGLLMLVRYQ